MDTWRHKQNRIGRVLTAALILAAGTLVVDATTSEVQALGCVAGPQEAEAGMITGFETAADAAASGGAYIHIPEGAGSRWSITPDVQATYCFLVDTAGRYRITANVWADSGTSDSFYVTVDGSPIGSGRWDVAHVAFRRDLVNSYQTADPYEVDLTTGEHTVSIHLREDGTRLDTIALEPVAVDPTCTGGWADAESAELVGFEIIREAGAHANQAIWVPEGAGSRWFPSADYRASFCFAVQQTGTYRLEADVKASSMSSDSFFVTVDNGPAVTWYVPNSDAYVTDLVNSWAVVDPAEFQLTAGNHTVQIYGREDGTKLDRLRFVARPDPQQRACAGPRSEAEAGSITGFVVGSDRAASGGNYIHVPDGAGSSWSPSNAAMATYCLVAPQAGNYRIVAGTWADTMNNDSFWVRVGASTPQRWDIAPGTTYGADVVGFGDADPYVFTADAGNVVVEVFLREDGARLDWIGLELVNP